MTATSEALLITDPGASNPSGVALALHNACRQVLAEGGNQRTDPAVRLICNQLVFLLEGTEVIGLEEYRKLVAHIAAPTPGGAPPPRNPAHPIRYSRQEPEGGAAGASQAGARARCISSPPPPGPASQSDRRSPCPTP